MINRTRLTLLAIVAAVCLVVGLTSPSVADSEKDLKKKKSDLNSKIDKAQGNADHSSKKLKEAEAALSKARSALSSAQSALGRTRGELAVAAAKDTETQNKLAAAEKALTGAVEQLAQGEADLAKSASEVERFTVESVQEGDSGLRAFSRLLSGDSPTQFTEQMSINDSVGDAQLAKMQELEASKVMLKIKRDRVRDLRDQRKAAREEAAKNLAVKQALEAEAEQQTEAVTQLVSRRKSLQATADQALQEDLALLRSLEADRNKVESQLAALARKDISTGGRGVGGDGGGTLSYPANGPITSPYGMRVHPVTGVYKLHDGTDFGVPCGTPVRAAASGTIIQQYFNAGYGNRIILNNGIKRGVSVVTTYNHLTSFKYGVGRKVARGEVIGYSGTTGYSTGCHLHFMVLVNGQTTNPMGWL